MHTHLPSLIHPCHCPCFCFVGRVLQPKNKERVQFSRDKNNKLFVGPPHLPDSPLSTRFTWEESLASFFASIPTSRRTFEAQSDDSTCSPSIFSITVPVDQLARLYLQGKDLFYTARRNLPSEPTPCPCRLFAFSFLSRAQHHPCDITPRLLLAWSISPSESGSKLRSS